jgi:hypothetical protein
MSAMVAGVKKMDNARSHRCSVFIEGILVSSGSALPAAGGGIIGGLRGDEFFDQFPGRYSALLAE